MSTLFFNTRYKTIASFSDFTDCIDYFNRDDRADKNLLSQNNYSQEAEDMMSYYFYRKGSSGCFDFNGDKSYETIMEEFQTYHPSYIWQSIISFTKEDAVEFNLKDKKDFAALTNKVVMKMSQEKGIPLRDVAWGGFYHVNTDHPHVHFYFYDKKHPLDNGLFSKKSIEKIRSIIGREVLDRTLLLKSKEDASRKVIEDMRSILNDKIFLKQLKDYRTQRTPQCMDYIHPSFKLKAEVFHQFISLVDKLPRKGRLSYNAHVMDDFREDINQLVKLFLTQNGLKEDFRVYSRLLDEIYQSNEELYGQGKRNIEYRDDQMSRLYSVLGNAVIKMVKSYRDMMDEYPEIHFYEYLTPSQIRKEHLKLIKPYVFDLGRFSFRHLKHEISQTRYMLKMRERNQLMMIRHAEKIERDSEKEKEVEYAS